MLIEIKYARSASDFKKIEKEVIEDSIAYLKDRSTYKKIVVFIYDASASVQEHATTEAALLELEHVIDVVIVSRPSHLPPPEAKVSNSTNTSKRSRKQTPPSQNPSPSP